MQPRTVRQGAITAAYGAKLPTYLIPRILA